MRVLYIILGLMLLTYGVAQTKIGDSKLDQGRALLKNLKNANAYNSFVNDYKHIRSEDIRERILSVAVMGARYHNNKTDFIFYKKALQKHFPETEYGDVLGLKGIGVECRRCNGEKRSPYDCSKCKGEGSCTNVKCNDGLVVTTNRVDGKFVEVEKECSICSGSGNCTHCDGKGERLGLCGPCRGKGLIPSREKIEEAYEKLVMDTVEAIVRHNDNVYTREMIAKGMTKIDGKWYTPAQIRRMESERTAEEQRALEERRRRELAEEAANLLDKSDALIEEDSDEVIRILENFIAANPKYERLKRMKIELTYCNLCHEAIKLEKKGSYGEAIKKYKLALEVRESDFVDKKIAVLDEQTIGL